MADKQLQDKLTTYLQDMYALENQLVETLEKHAGQAEKFPNVQAKIREHLEQTKQHRTRMEQRLDAYGERPSALKGALSTVMGSAGGVMSGMRADTLAMNTRDDYISEQMEIAGYLMLIATARAAGDTETVRVAELNLRDEQAMQQWLAQHLGEAALLSLQQDGITIPAAAMEQVRQATYIPAADQPGMMGPA